MKKFYKLVSAKKADEGYAIQLDGKSVITPSGQKLVSPSKTLAEAIAKEWADQGDEIKPDAMPLTALLNTTIDRARERDSITKKLVKYLDTDLLCYRAQDAALIALEKEQWDPWLTWFDEHFEVSLDITSGLDALTQDEEAHKRVWNYIEGLDEYYFGVLQVVTALSGSIVMGLAFIEGAASPEQVFDVYWLEETHHARIANEAEHGEDPIIAKKQAAMRVDLEAARRFLDAIDAA